MLLLALWALVAFSQQHLRNLSLARSSLQVLGHVSFYTLVRKAPELIPPTPAGQYHAITQLNFLAKATLNLLFGDSPFQTIAVNCLATNAGLPRPVSKSYLAFEEYHSSVAISVSLTWASVAAGANPAQKFSQQSLQATGLLEASVYSCLSFNIF